jgi:hypothetical protein
MRKMMKKELQMIVYTLCLILGGLFLIGCANREASAFVAALPADKNECDATNDEHSEASDELPVVDIDLPNLDDGEYGNESDSTLGFTNIVWTIPGKNITTIEFGSDGQVHGSGGCNSFAGSYHTDGDQLDLSQLISTMMACEEEVSQREIDFLATLATVSQYRLEMEQLILSDSAGNDVLVFMAEAS